MTDDKELEKPDRLSLILNILPFAHLASGCGLMFAGLDTVGQRVAFAFAWIYLLPPLVARFTLAVYGIPAGQLTQDTRGYRVWWFLTQWQTLFNRLPWLEEVLRLVPGLYAFWIGLWGGHLSPFAYVGPGVVITDRYLVYVERGAVLGFKSALAAHMVIRDQQGRYVVVVAAPVVEAEAILGGYAGLGPGAILRAGHLLPSGRRVAPFGEWPRRKFESEAI
ncbi:MAG: hypothetical protein FD135_3470 [Comamonadaceae bacterium]|nr:MAG: hypothetical protein FD135_3470 [Comamonadaceae bacterium]